MCAAIEWSLRVFLVVVSEVRREVSGGWRYARRGRTKTGGAGLAELLKADLVFDVAEVVDRFDVSLGESDLEATTLGDDVCDFILRSRERDQLGVKGREVVPMNSSVPSSCSSAPELPSYL